jgi:hypothetical protein
MKFKTVVLGAYPEISYGEGSKIFILSDNRKLKYTIYYYYTIKSLSM